MSSPLARAACVAVSGMSLFVTIVVEESERILASDQRVLPPSRPQKYEPESSERRLSRWNSCDTQRRGNRMYAPHTANKFSAWEEKILSSSRSVFFFFLRKKKCQEEVVNGHHFVGRSREVL